MATQGPNGPSTTIDDSSSGGSVAWLNPNNAQASDGVFTTYVGTGSSTFSHYLKATNFGFSIPTSATVNGILVEIQELAGGSGGNVSNLYAKLIKAGTIQSTNKGINDSMPTTEAYKSYGGLSDLWSGTWTPSDINNSGFGFAFAAQVQTPYTNTGYIDYVRITVAYTDIPTVTTQAVSLITSTTAIGNGNVTADGGATITQRGVCWSTSSGSETAGGNHATASGTTGAFTASMTGLAPSTTYYVKAYAINSIGTSYGSEVSFTTLYAGYGNIGPLPTYYQV